MSRLAELAEITGRPPIRFRPPDVAGKRILVTGAAGFIGQAVAAILRKLRAAVVPCDLEVGVPISHPEFGSWVERQAVDGVVHLAAHKHAPAGEERPWEVADLNIFGTEAVIASMPPDVPIVLASTCKAADPCTAYGASKLIAERMVLNEPGGVAVRLVNVLDSSGSLLRIWAQLPDDAPIPVVPEAVRYWMTPLEAAEALTSALALPGGLWAPAVGTPIRVSEIAYRAAPDRPTIEIPLRRGDRLTERLVGEYETAVQVDEAPGFVRILTPWETRPEPEA